MSVAGIASRAVPEAPPAADASRVLAFEAGGRALALPAAAVERVLEVPPVQRVPGTPGWFLGLAVTGGRLLPLSDLGVWLDGAVLDGADVAPAPASGGRGPGARVVALDASVGLAALLVDRVDGLADAREAEAADLAGDDPLARLGPRRPRARAIVVEGTVRALLDPAALLASPAFADLAGAP